MHCSSFAGLTLGAFLRRAIQGAVALMKVLVQFTVAFAILGTQQANAQTTLAQLQTDLVSTWLVKVNGENRTRTLRINGIEQKAVDTFLLDAVYGMSDERQSTVKAEVNQIGQERTLILITQAASKIVVTQMPTGAFSGTFTLKNGTTKGISFEKISENDLKSTVTSALNSVPTIEKPAADVPAPCASFLGGWSGVWPNIGRTWLWVVSVDAKCGAKYSYGISSSVPNSYKTADIKEGVLTLPRPSGATYFQLQGDELSGRYSGSDGENSASLQRVQLSGDSLAALRAEQKAASVITAPAADVPASCASFFGGWTGTWSQGGFGAQWLRIVSVDAKCIAKFTYSSSKTIMNDFQTAEIKQGELSFVCNKSTGGTCVFERHGAELWGSYSNSGGGRNNGVFRKIN